MLITLSTNLRNIILRERIQQKRSRSLLEKLHSMLAQLNQKRFFLIVFFFFFFNSDIVNLHLLFFQTWLNQDILLGEIPILAGNYQW